MEEVVYSTMERRFDWLGEGVNDGLLGSWRLYDWRRYDYEQSVLAINGEARSVRITACSVMGKLGWIH